MEDECQRVPTSTLHGEQSSNLNVMSMVTFRHPCLIGGLLNGINSLPIPVFVQVNVTVGGQTKGTAATYGEDDPSWDEMIEFAIPGDVSDRDGEQVHASIQSGCASFQGVIMVR